LDTLAPLLTIGLRFIEIEEEAQKKGRTLSVGLFEEAAGLLFLCVVAACGRHVEFCFSRESFWTKNDSSRTSDGMLLPCILLSDHYVLGCVAGVAPLLSTRRFTDFGFFSFPFAPAAIFSSLILPSNSSQWMCLLGPRSVWSKVFS
jgi:hypothetical protein